MNTNKLSVKSILVSLSLALFGVTGFAACAAPVDSSEEAVSAGEEQVGEAQGALSDYCYGYWRCPNTGAAWNWGTGPTACGQDGELGYSTAHTLCEAACSVACTVTRLGCYSCNP
jgi:hypothetical protein